MQLDLIYTYDNNPQKRITYPFVAAIMVDNETFFEFITSILTGEEKENLVKISCCIYYGIGYETPEFYNTRNGKYYLAEIIELLDKVWKIESTVSQHTKDAIL